MNGRGSTGRPARRIAVRSALLGLLAAFLWALPGAEGQQPRQPTATAPLPAHHLAGGFRNIDPAWARGSSWRRVQHFVRRLGPMLRGEPRFVALPAAAADVVGLRENGHEATVTWVGHSTLLVQLDGVNILTDPHWSSRTGPFGGTVGVRRYTPPGIAFEDLPPIHLVLVSHDHYDHLDEPTVIRLARTHDPRFVVPLGIRAWLEDRGITNVVELDWGETTGVRGLTVVCTPAQHFSGRTLRDQGRRLWASFAVLGSKRFYFGGDSGYFRHFKEIGDAWGPFDLAALPIGSYTPRQTTRSVHTSPEDALQAWLDVRAARFLGIHWGTFPLGEEPYDEPPRRLVAEAARRALDPEAIWVLKPGELRHW